MLSKENAKAVAEAIMTTDTFSKTCVVRSDGKGKAVHIAGIAKGAGMIHPQYGHHAFFHHHGRR
jgi:glutamate N-acetyltransferase / amino-acid N-acetyltransferase